MAKRKKKLSEIRDALFSNTSYLNENTQQTKEKVKLADNFRRLTDRGVKALLSNSYHHKIPKLYDGFNIVSVKARIDFLICKCIIHLIR